MSFVSIHVVLIFEDLEEVFIYGSFNLARYSNFPKNFLAILGNFSIWNLKPASLAPKEYSFGVFIGMTLNLQMNYLCQFYDARIKDMVCLCTVKSSSSIKILNYRSCIFLVKFILRNFISLLLFLIGSFAFFIFSNWLFL